MAFVLKTASQCEAKVILGVVTVASYFKPLRRKIGVVTLVLSCVFMAGWMRSYVTIDSIYRPWPGQSGGSSVIESEKGHVFWYSSRQPWCDTKLSFPTLNSNSVAASSNILTSDEVRWSIKSFGFAIGEFEPPPAARGRPNRIVWVIPHFHIAIPLTLLSAYLLLSKPRASKPLSK